MPAGSQRISYFPDGRHADNEPIFPPDVLNSIGYISYMFIQIGGENPEHSLYVYKDNGNLLANNIFWWMNIFNTDYYISEFKIPIFAPTVDIDLESINADGGVHSTIVYLDKNSIKARNVWRN
jgi:hypothetical protein